MSFDLKLTNGTITLENGSLSQVRNFAKLAQDVVKILVTPIGASVAHPWYGSALSERVVGTPLSGTALEQEIANVANYALQNLKSLQEQQSRAGQLLTPGERIVAIEGVTIMQSGDVRGVAVVVRVRTATGESVEEAITLNL